jgi:hypothetical protein
MEVKPEHRQRPRTNHKHRSRDDYMGKNKSKRRPRRSGGHKKKERAMVAGASNIDSSSYYSSSSSNDEEENRHKGKRSGKNINGLSLRNRLDTTPAPPVFPPQTDNFQKPIMFKSDLGNELFGKKRVKPSEEKKEPKGNPNQSQNRNPSIVSIVGGWAPC